MDVGHKTPATTLVRRASAITLLASLVFSSLPASALTGQEVLDGMSSEESGSYLFGSMEMAAFLAHAAGNSERSRCIMEWYENDGGAHQVVQALDKFKDRQTQPVLLALINRACGE